MYNQFKQKRENWNKLNLIKLFSTSYDYNYY